MPRHTADESGRPGACFEHSARSDPLSSTLTSAARGRGAPGECVRDCLAIQRIPTLAENYADSGKPRMRRKNSVRDNLSRKAVTGRYLKWLERPAHNR